jgi:hypothetical protein
MRAQFLHDGDSTYWFAIPCRACACGPLARNPQMGDFEPRHPRRPDAEIVGTPPEVIERLNREIYAGLESPGLKARYADLGATPFAGSPADLGKFMAEDTEKWAKVIKAAPSFGVEVSPIGVDDAEQIERGITAFARAPNGGLIVLAQPTTVVHRNLIIKFAAQHRLPAVYNSRLFAAQGGLMSYGPDILDQYRSAAGYVDRILRGAKPDDLPVQAPTKFELVINLKTAKALGLTVPDSLLARADEVIE